MLDSWKKHGIDTMLHDAAKKGTVMAGGSAGMLAWFDSGHSDSLSYRVKNEEPWDYVFIKGLGYIAATGCPHFDNQTGNAELRATDFKSKFIADDTLPPTGIGIDNMAALAIDRGKFRVISEPNSNHPNAAVNIISKTENNLEEYPLPILPDYEKLEI